MFDGSARGGVNNLPLNDCLEKGPNNRPHIFDVSIKFRGHPIGIVADVEKAFHQIFVKPTDCNMLKFLWFDDAKLEVPHLVQYRFCCLVFGLTPSPAILTETIQHHITCYLISEPEIAEKLSSGFYVDDFTSGVQTIEEGLILYQKAWQSTK